MKCTIYDESDLSVISLTYAIQSAFGNKEKGSVCIQHTCCPAVGYLLPSFLSVEMDKMFDGMLHSPELSFGSHVVGRSCSSRHVGKKSRFMQPTGLATTEKK